MAAGFWPFFSGDFFEVELFDLNGETATLKLHRWLWGGGVGGCVPFPDSGKPCVFEEALQLEFLSFPPRTSFPAGVQECGRGSAAAASGPPS